MGIGPVPLPATYKATGTKSNYRPGLLSGFMMMNMKQTKEKNGVLLAIVIWLVISFLMAYLCPMTKEQYEQRMYYTTKITYHKAPR
jgi:hypothetical protein